jgi:hypothetical protein
MLLNLSPHYPDRSASLLTSDEARGECGDIAYGTLFA